MNRIEEQLWKEANELIDSGDEATICQEIFELKKQLYELKNKQEA